MNKFKEYIPEGVILSLLNLALLALTNKHHSDCFWIAKHSSHATITDDSWPLILMAFSLIIAFLVTKLKKIQGKSRKYILFIYTFIPLIIDLCFRSDREIYYTSLIWIFLLVSLCWILLRYEIDKYIKVK